MSQYPNPTYYSPPSYPGGFRPVRPTNGLAIASLVTALLGMAILPVIFGHLALRQIRSRDEDGSGLAWAGLILGWGQLILYTLFFLAVAIGIWGIWNA